MGGEHYEPDMIRRIVELKLQGYTDNNVVDKIKEEFDRVIDHDGVKKCFNNELARIGQIGAGRSDLDKEEVIQQMVDIKAKKMEILLQYIDDIISKTEGYRQKLVLWVSAFEEDIAKYYAEKKAAGLNLNHVMKTQDALAKNIQLLNVNLNELMQMLRIQKEFIELAKPKTVEYNILEMQLHSGDRFKKIKEVEPRFEAITVIDKEFRELIQKAKLEGKVVDNIS